MNNLLSPFSDIDKAINKRRLKSLKHYDSIRFLRSSLTMVLILILFILLFLYFFKIRFVKGNDMFPAISDGDIVMCYEEKEYKKNDIVFYTSNDEQYIGRVVAKGGDTVDISETGILTVNGTDQNGEILFPTKPPADWNGKITVPDNSVFILGDYRNEAVDSRDFGCIPLENVKDKVIALLRHRKF